MIVFRLTSLIFKGRTNHLDMHGIPIAYSSIIRNSYYLARYLYTTSVITLSNQLKFWYANEIMIVLFFKRPESGQRVFRWPQINVSFREMIRA